MKVGGKPKAGHTIHKEINYNAVSLVGHINMCVWFKSLATKLRM